MKTKILLSRKESVFQFNEPRDLCPSAAMADSNFLVWRKNGLTKKFLNG
jgi:hypothetical protein